MTPKKKPEPEPDPVSPQTRRVSDVIWQALIAAVVAMFLGWMQQRAANRVEDVRVTLEKSTSETTEKLDEVQKTTVETHRIINSGSIVQLKLLAIAHRRIANGPDATKEDVEAAELSEKALEEREAEQVKLDNRKEAQ